MAEDRRTGRPTLRVSRLQVEVAQAKVEADRARGRAPDPLVAKIASAGRGPGRRLAG